MTILMFRCRAANIMHRLAYCTSCRGMVCYQSTPYETEWSELQKLNWAQECDEHRSLCDQWIEEHHAKLSRDAPASSPPTAAGPISPPGQGVGVSPSAPTPSPGNAQGEAAEGLCACGREAVAMQFQMGPNKGQVWCTKCGRRVA